MSNLSEAGPVTRNEAEIGYEAKIAALDGAPTGAPLSGGSWIFLALSGVILPIMILIWGWI